MCISSGGNKEERDRSKEIDAILANEKKKEQSVKLLLLGAGESGKSTIAKQLKIIHLDGFTDDEKMSFKSLVYSNIMGSMKVLIEEGQKLEIPLEHEANKQLAEKFLSDAYYQGEITRDIGEDIKTLWQDAGIKTTFSRSAEFQLNDSTEYYFENIDRIATPGYLPSVDDVLRSRAKTTGIIETVFYIQRTKFTLVDVGGQRSERRKWMHCFQDVTAVIFCVAMSAYDQKLYEDETTNRMHEALKLFKDICNSKWFAETAIILFLNKKDLFEKKVQKVPLTVCFKDYQGDNSYEDASKYIEEIFLLQNGNPKKAMYVHHTCATDTNNIAIVFKAVQDIILTKILDRMGMLN